jgi:peptidoglycan hydrolase-like protein with peptidoglycan-binding domain
MIKSVAVSTPHQVRQTTATGRVEEVQRPQTDLLQVRDGFDPNLAAARPANDVPMTRVLRRGSRGEDVERLQQTLRDAGFDVGEVDGKFGPRTEAALKAYQQANGLRADGRAGEDTFGAMGLEYIGRRRRPAAGGQAPAAGGQAPAAGEQAPAAGGQAPAAGGQAPAAGGQAPAAGGQAPAAGGQAPAAGGQAPAAGGQAPAAGASGPSAVGDAGDLEARRAVARRLVRAGGSATQEDVDAVVGELEKMPLAQLEQMERNGTKVVAARGSVTDARTDLRGVQPRGWPPGKTWDQVPGAFMPDTNEVVVATQAGPNGSRQVPPTGSSHGSANLVLHEAGHALDYRGGKPSDSAEFQRAYEADRAAMPAYLQQPGNAGREEAYAETLALYLQDPAECRRRYPNLSRYWDTTLNGGQS